MKTNLNQPKLYQTMISYSSFWNVLKPVRHGENSLGWLGCSMQILLLGGGHGHSLASLL